MNHCLVFEIGPPRGHNAFYVRVLAEYWARHPFPGALTLVVQPALYAELGDFVQGVAARGVRFVCLSQAEVATRHALEQAQPPPAFATLLAEGAAAPHNHAQGALHYDWDLLQRYAERIGATHAFIPRIDTYLPLLAAGIASCTPISGILLATDYFRAEITNAEAQSRKVRSKFIFARAFKQPELHTLFMLDHPSVQAATAQFGTSKAHYLPDPVEVVPVASERVSHLRAHRAIDANRRVALLFGDLTERKGVLLLLEALAHLPLELGAQLCVLMVGTMDAAHLRQAQPKMEPLRQQHNLQLVLHNAYVPQGDVAAYFSLADVVLMPYIAHAGMSGVLLWAAAADRPVIASDYGLVGELVRNEQLGLVVKSDDPLTLAAALTRYLQNVATPIHSSTSARALVERHHAPRFAETIFTQLGFTMM